MATGAARALRVVSTLPAATEIVVALGAADSLVGISHQCVLPPSEAPRTIVTSGAVNGSATAGEIHEQVGALTAAGSGCFSLLAEVIGALHPHVILTQALCDVCAVSETDVRALAARLSPTPRVVTLGGTTLDGIFADIGAVAEPLGLTVACERLNSSLRTRMRRVHNVLSASRAPRPRVAVIEWTDPPFAAGHWVPEMVYRAGGADVLAVAGQHSREIPWETVADAAPEVVLIAPCGYGAERAAEEGRALMASNRWLARRTVWALDAARLVSQPGPGLVDGIEVFAAIFNPGLFDTPSTTRAIPLSVV